jgi:hypothetical protein
VATPVNWKQGDNVIILPSLGEEEAKKPYPGGWKASARHKKGVCFSWPVGLNENDN